MSEPFIGEVRVFGFNFAPRGWAFCHGQLMSIAQNTALFSLLGTTYGGDGQTTFGLPDLRSRVPMHFGQGPGLTNYSVGDSGGAEQRTLSTANLPAHSHALQASSGPGTHPSPAGAVLAGLPERFEAPFTAGTPDVAMSAQSVGATGSGAPFSVVPPFLVLNFCIALEGLFPSRP